MGQLKPPVDIGLRDWFAATSLDSLIHLGGSVFESGMILADNLAQNSYKLADAMMRARSLPVGPESVPLIIRKSSKPKASPEQVDQIISLHKLGHTNKQIADKLGINGQSVNGVVATSRRKGVIINKES